MNTNVSIKEVQAKYNLSKFTLNRIKQTSWYILNKPKARNIAKINTDELENLIKAIKDYKLETKHTFSLSK